MKTITYSIGDVHGCLDQLIEATNWAAEDASSREAEGLVVLLGDYIDRGPNSSGVLDLLMRGPDSRRMRWLPLKGNHDDMLARTWRDPGCAMAGAWWEYGGQQTLMSFGWDPIRDPVPSHLGEWIPERYVEFIESLPAMYEDADRIFVHAGLRPGVPVERQNEHDLFWIRSEFLRSDEDFGKVVVHGHTPGRRNPSVTATRVNLDTGCFATGHLACAAFEPGEPSPTAIRLFGRGMDESLAASPGRVDVRGL